MAQEYEISLPRELPPEENWRLICDFARERLVARGRICDVNLHLAEAADGLAQPHAHVLMPTREVGPKGFGAKHADVSWKNYVPGQAQGPKLADLRAEWCDFARARATELGVELGPGWDERSYEAQGLGIEGQPKRGAAADRMEEQGTATERAAEVLAAQRRNGERLLADPGLALKALTARQSTFTEHDLARWIHRHSDDAQFEAIYLAAKAKAVVVGRDDARQERFSTAEMVALEERMVATAWTMAERQAHPVRGAIVDRTMRAAARLSDEQETAARAIIAGGDLTCLVGLAGSGKSTMLAEVRRALEAQGYAVRGAALSGIAAENLAGSGIEARTLASWERGWSKSYDLLSERDVLVLDEAGMVGSHQLASMLERAREAGAKVVLVGDAEQLQAIEAGGAFRAIADRFGAAELTEVRRHKVDWQRAATRELATGRTGAALERYAAGGAVRAAETAEAARAALVARWTALGDTAPEQSRLLLAHTRADVRALNDLARAGERAAGRVAAYERIYDTTAGDRAFSAGDRLLFLRNERALGVKNGSMGTVEAAEDGRLAVRLDGGKTVAFDPADYPDIDHAYAVTVHKSQGKTVDRAFVLATGGFDRHLAYVALSRHREGVELAYSRDEFKNGAALQAALGRRRVKDTTVDYLAEPAPPLVPERPARAANKNWSDRYAELLAREREQREMAEQARRTPTLRP